MQGAGGVSGLLAIHPAPSASSSSFVPAYDGNGNLTTLIRTTDRSVAAAYEYGPFGEPIRATGPMANANPFRFSTKYTDSETGFLYYGYRFYDLSLLRFRGQQKLGNNPKQHEHDRNEKTHLGRAVQTRRSRAARKRTQGRPARPRTGDLPLEPARWEATPRHWSCRNEPASGAQRRAGERRGSSAVAAAVEIAALRRELDSIRAQNDILKKALAIVAQQEASATPSSKPSTLSSRA
jgi:RHS repeat-associated protein